MSVDRREIALDLAELGYHVFPCRPHRKEPLTSNGFKDATTDERTILHWFDAHPDANVGTSCGASGIVVLDVDVKHEGMRALNAFDDLVDLLADDVGPEMLARAQVLTGTSEDGLRGSHLYFRGRERTCQTTAVGIELRGVGSYVLAPGSVHPSGARYEICDDLAGIEYPDWRLPAVARLPELPGAVRAILPANGGARTPVRDWRTIAREGVREGGRNVGCARLAGHLLGRGVDPHVALELVTAWNRDRNRPPLSDDEVTGVVCSIASREASKWR